MNLSLANQSGRTLLTGVLAALALVGALVLAGAAPAKSFTAGDTAYARHLDAQSALADQRAKPGPRTVRLKIGRAVSLVTLQAVPARRASRPATSVTTPGWRLKAKPPRSKRTLDQKAATFHPDLPGRYVLVRGNGRGARNRLILHATPAEELVCLNTRAWDRSDPSSAHIRVGSTDYKRSGPGLQVVVLSRTHLGEITGVTANQTFAQDAAGYPQFAAFLAKLGNSALVFVSGTVSRAEIPTVWGPLARLGAADLPSPFPDTPVAFSFIGIPGLDRGEGWQAVDGNATRPVQTRCDSGLTGEPTNNLSGWLTLDSTGLSYTYVAGDDVAVDTNAAAAPGSHAIAVGNQTYTIQVGEHANGWHALVLERASLCPTQAAAAACTPPAPLLHAGYAQDGGGLDALTAALTPLAGNPDALTGL
jgi:hypothetical protein